MRLGFHHSDLSDTVIGVVLVALLIAGGAYGYMKIKDKAAQPPTPSAAPH